MDERKKRTMSRKEFLEKSSKGLLALGLLSGNSSLISCSKGGSDLETSRYRMLGRTGLKVSVVGYGASRTMEPTLVKRALDSGMNFLDTGRSYFNGQNEVMLGKILNGIRQEVIIQSKISLRLREQGEELKSAGVSRRIKTMMESSLQESLKALQTDYIDVMLLHGARSVDMIQHETVIGFFETAKKNGQIRACGFSTHANQVEVMKSANQSGFYDVVMVTFNHKGSYVHMNSGRYSEWDQPALEIEMEKAKKHNIGIVAMKTCSAGPYAFEDEEKPSFKSALKWVANHDTVHTMAAAMGNIEEIQENVLAMS